MRRKICTRLQYCYPTELGASTPWKEIPVRSSLVVIEEDVSAHEEGHLVEVKVKASMLYDRANSLLARAYDPVILRTFVNDGSTEVIGSVLSPVILDYTTDEVVANLDFTCKYPLP